jgi:hypothetical protein
MRSDGGGRDQLAVDATRGEQGRHLARLKSANSDDRVPIRTTVAP